ncbi:MAG TPA: hypothetical protein DCQ11_10185 [Gammaproteobacteria bacterium]|nr:hypothetical protein [Gammaproteobacteria bacterium]
MLGQYDQAIADYSKVIKLAPTYAFAYLVRSQAHRELGHVVDQFLDGSLACER